MKTRFPVLLLFLALLTGCSTVYYPVFERASDDDYQTQDSQVARGPYYGSSPARYADMGLYPWWSMDYFYLGYHPYSYWRSAYYSPYFYSHYNAEFYPPQHWYFHYGYSGFYAWNDPYRHYRYRHRHHGPSYGGGHRTPRYPQPSGNRWRSTVAPSAGSSRRSMIIVRPAEQKNRLVRIPPVRPSGLKATVTPSMAVPTSAPRVISSRSAGGSVTPGRRSTEHARASTPTQSSSSPSRSTSVSARSSAHRQASDRSHRPSTGRERLER